MNKADDKQNSKSNIMLEKLSAGIISQKLETNSFGRSLAILKSVGSTNTYLKERESLLPNGFAAISQEQLSGRGRTGKQFSSPNGGLYMSVLLKGDEIFEPDNITVKAAVAVCHAIEKLSGLSDLKIKWVNDIYYDDRKLGGILAERAYCSSKKNYTVLGVGINVNTNNDSLSEKAKEIASSIYDFTKEQYSINLLASYVLHELERYFSAEKYSDTKNFMEEYRKRSLLIGKEIYILRREEEIPAKVLGIDDDASLYVEYVNGKSEIIRAGEVSTRLKK